MPLKLKKIRVIVNFIGKGEPGYGCTGRQEKKGIADVTYYSVGAGLVTLG
jgi:hypothetical protein